MVFMRVWRVSRCCCCFVCALAVCGLGLWADMVGWDASVWDRYVYWAWGKLQLSSEAEWSIVSPGRGDSRLRCFVDEAMLQRTNNYPCRRHFVPRVMGKSTSYMIAFHGHSRLQAGFPVILKKSQMHLFPEEE